MGETDSWRDELEDALKKLGAVWERNTFQALAGGYRICLHLSGQGKYSVSGYVESDEGFCQSPEYRISGNCRTKQRGCFDPVLRQLTASGAELRMLEITDALRAVGLLTGDPSNAEKARIARILSEQGYAPLRLRGSRRRVGDLLQFKLRPKAKFDEPTTPYAMGFITARQKAATIVREWALAERVDRRLLLSIADQIEDQVVP